MTIECAVSMAFKRCARLVQVIEANESSWQSMDWKRRNEMGMLRCLMHNAGVERDQLPEMPFLDPKHLAAYLKRKDEHKAAQEAANEAHTA